MKPILPSLLCAAVLLSSCADHHIHKGDQAYALMAYAKAERHYTRAKDKLAERAVLLRAADAARRQNHMPQAAELYQKAEALGVLSGDDAFRYGQALMATGRTQEAEQHFLSVLQERPEDRAAQDLYASCAGYRSFYADTTHFTVSELPLPGISTCFSAIPYKNGLVFAGEREAPGYKANPWNGMSFLDLYYANKHTLANWDKAEPLKGVVNGPYHEGPAVFSADGRTLYFTRSNYYKRKLNKDASDVSHLKLFRAQLDDHGEWSGLHEFAYNGETYSVGHPALSADGRTLYFASDMPGGFGGSDIWKCVDQGSGWGKPENLGAMVNTPGNELFPTVNGDALYFSSTAHDNMGGLDIFEMHPEGDHWSAPRNMNYPINTPHDDFAFVMDSTGKSGFISSDRNGRDRVHVFFLNEPTFMVEGFVTDDSTGLYLPNTLVTLTDLVTDQDTSIMTGADGKFNLKLAANRPYTVKAEHEGMLTRTQLVSTVGLTANTTLHADLRLTALELNKPIAVNNIYYDYDSWDIRPDAAIELDKVAKVFIDNPLLTFELSSHTDSRGGDTYNLVLSDARARSAVDYLIRKGVDPQRVTARGYGESMLMNRCSNGVKCTEEEHQANRRTEFRVTSVKEVAQQKH
ncbi:MAG: OmpA family protein [Flavobacteriales bacterium]